MTAYAEYAEAVATLAGDIMDFSEIYNELCNDTEMGALLASVDLTVPGMIRGEEVRTPFKVGKGQEAEAVLNAVVTATDAEIWETLDEDARALIMRELAEFTDAVQRANYIMSDELASREAE